MFRCNIPIIRRLLVMGLVFLLLLSFLSCSQDSISNPRNLNEEDENTSGEDREDPSEDSGVGKNINRTPSRKAG